jgi:hypothetical protein
MCSRWPNEGQMPALPWQSVFDARRAVHRLALATTFLLSKRLVKGYALCWWYMCLTNAASAPADSSAARGEYVGQQGDRVQSAVAVGCELYYWHNGIRQIVTGQQRAGKTEQLLKEARDDIPGSAPCQKQMAHRHGAGVDSKSHSGRP